VKSRLQNFAFPNATCTAYTAVRLSIGLENIEDIIDDLEQALEFVTAVKGSGCMGGC
jgi:O-acetylhomoserine/O-acetylserine sulfhydrylase-like pyridoxal-dependent enzyme